MCGCVIAVIWGQLVNILIRFQQVRIRLLCQRHMKVYQTMLLK